MPIEYRVQMSAASILCLLRSKPLWYLFSQSTNNHLQINQRLIACQRSTCYSVNKASLVRVQSDFYYFCEPLLRHRDVAIPLFPLVALPVLGGMFTSFYI